MSPTTSCTRRSSSPSRHDADDGLGARRADDETAALRRAAPCPTSMACLTPACLQRRAVGVAHVLQDLRQRLEALAHLAHRLAGADHHRQHLQRSHQAVAGGGEVRQHDVARLLAADVVAVLAHVLHDVAVADRRARQRQARALEVALQAEVRHDRGDDAAGRRAPAACQLSAITAMIWSPSTMRPFSSTITTRSASPSSAMPMSARISRTLSHERFRRGRAALVS